MSDAQAVKDPEIEAALLDAELFLKYSAPERAFNRLREAIERRPRSVHLREKLREVAVAVKRPEEAARQCLGLAGLYIEREDFDAAHDRLLEAKQLDSRISITQGLEAIRRARRPGAQIDSTHAAPPVVARRAPTLAGDLSAVSIFDAVQILENARLSGVLAVEAEAGTGGRVFFNEGRIVGAEAAGDKGEAAFRQIVQAAAGTFEFERSPQGNFPVTINAASNTNLILDSLRRLDEESQK